MSGLYIPLKDDEGIVGILHFEASSADFATQRQRELAGILANQATVALRNARLYHQVPLADAIGALKIGADFLICPDNTIHQALPLIAARSPLPWLHIAEVVAGEAVARGSVAGDSMAIAGPCGRPPL